MARGVSDGEWKSESELEREQLLLGRTEEPTLYVGEMITRTPPTPASLPSTAREIRTSPTSTLQLRTLTYADADRLWDWARENNAGAAKFLGAMPAHSKALHDYLQLLLEQQEHGTALVRCIYVGETHIGFIVLKPITRTGPSPTAVVHCYLAPSVQGQLSQLLPSLLAIAAEQEPALTLMVMTDDYAFAKLLQPYGFTLQIALTRPPSSTSR